MLLYWLTNPKDYYILRVDFESTDYKLQVEIMKFYCLFDLINYFRKNKGDTEKDMYDFFRKEKIKKSTLLFYKDNCSIEQAKEILPAIEKYTGLSVLEIYLALGVIPEKYKDDFFSNIHEIAELLRKNHCEPQVPKTEITPFFRTDLGTLYNEDCVKVLNNIPSETVDLVFADPPFNLSKVYDEGIDDALSTTDYIDWCFTWISECVRILKPGGSLFIYNIPKWTSIFSEFLNKRLTLRSWIAVDMKFSLPLSGRLYPAHYGLLYYIKGEKPNTFNNQRIPIQTCRHCGGEIKDYGGYKNKMNPRGVNVSDVWADIYPVRHKSQKNRAYNELSVKMLDRIISMSTNPGDVVFDPFGGSGTTFIVAEMLGRRWLGSEMGNCTVISDRFNNIAKDKALLAKVYEEKDTIFSENVRLLRKKNGFWLNEDFLDAQEDHDEEKETNHQMRLDEIELLKS